MEPQELALIETLAPKHDELRYLWSQHLDYEKDLNRLTVIRYPSEAERRQIGKIKRLKLRGKERITAILEAHRNI